MIQRQADPATSGSDRGLFFLLLLALFATEMAVMELFAAIFPRIGLAPSALIDSALLVFLLFWPSWFLVVSPRRSAHPAATHLRRHQVRVLLQILASIFLINTLMMLFEPQLWDPSNRPFSNFLDACLVTLTVAPVLRWLLKRGRLERQRATLADLLGTPMGIYVLLLFMVFFADLLQAHLMVWVLPGALYLSWQIVDAIITTLMLAPVLWFLVALPLRRRMLNEQTRIQAIHDQLIDAVVTIDADGLINSFNPAAEKIFGYTADEVTGQPVDRLLDTEEPRFADLARLAGEPGNDQAQPFRELVGLRKDGTALTLDVSFSPIYQYGRTEFLLVMRDISSRREDAEALRESNTRFRQIFEQSEDAILFFKPGTYYIIDANATAEKLFGIPREEMRGSELERFCRAEDFGRLSRAISGLREESSVQLENLAGRRGDGTEFIFSMRGKIMSLQGVRIVYCTFRDITERVRMEEESRDIQARLIQANKMTALGLMVSGVAHEINNPNNYIMANSQLLATCWGDALKVLHEYYRENGEFYIGGTPFSEFHAGAPKLVAGILDGSRRINEIVNNLKSFARDDRGAASQSVDINRMAASAVSILQHELVRYTEDFRFEPGDDLPVVMGSSQQLGQVLINLLMNACQALPDRKRGIRLATGFDAAAREVTLTVSDQGTGLSAEAGRRIFEPFFTTKLDNGGTGLGLSICQSIVKEHGGQIGFESAPGQGTTFTIRLPGGTTAAKGTPP